MNYSASEIQSIEEQINEQPLQVFRLIMILCKSRDKLNEIPPPYSSIDPDNTQAAIIVSGIKSKYESKIKQCYDKLPIGFRILYGMFNPDGYEDKNRSKDNILKYAADKYFIPPTTPLFNMDPLYDKLYSVVADGKCLIYSAFYAIYHSQFRSLLDPAIDEMKKFYKDDNEKEEVLKNCYLSSEVNLVSGNSIRQQFDKIISSFRTKQNIFNNILPTYDVNNGTTKKEQPITINMDFSSLLNSNVLGIDSSFLLLIADYNSEYIFFEITSYPPALGQIQIFYDDSLVGKKYVIFLVKTDHYYFWDLTNDEKMSLIRLIALNDPIILNPKRLTTGHLTVEYFENILNP